MRFPFSCSGVESASETTDSLRGRIRRTKERAREAGATENGERRHEKTRSAGHSKMGPASLPTPLSPMRGPAETGTWHPAVSQPRTEARDRVRRRRSHRHPGTPSCYPAWPIRGEPLRRPCAKTLDGHFRDRDFLMAGAVGTSVRIKDPPRYLAGIRPVGPIRSDAPLRLSVIDRRACRQSPCTRQSRDRRGQTSPRLSGSNLSSDIRSLDRRSPGISAPFRWIETAPAMPTPQALRARLIHCRPISLWTRVDNSTLRRKSRCSAQGCETILPSSSAIPRCDRVAPAA